MAGQTKPEAQELPEQEPAPEAPAVTFAQTARARQEELPLDWPLVTADGREITALTLRRLTGEEVAAVQEAMVGGDDIAMLSLFTGEPAEVIKALDQDDMVELRVKVADFLPRRLRAELEAVQEQLLDQLKSSPGEA